MADFVRSVAAHGAANCIVETAKRAGLLNGSVNTLPELAEIEKKLFIDMLKATMEYANQHQGDLHANEISSMFTFVAAKAAECAATLVDGKTPKLELHGLFDGKIPIAATEQLIGYFKKLSFPADCAENFLNYFEEEAPANADPQLTLFEALKWCFRLSFHIAWEFNENLMNPHHHGDCHDDECHCHDEECHCSDAEECDNYMDEDGFANEFQDDDADEEHSPRK